MTPLLSAATAAAPLALGWSLHALQLHRRLEHSRKDPLTGLHTRNAWTTRATRVINRNPRPAVLLLDLDDFKPINDAYGHAAGDAVLTATAARLTDWSGPHAAVGRLGGDEFVAALPDHTGLREQLPLLRELLSQPVAHGRHVFTVSASIGVAVLADLPTPTLTTALGKADEAMYLDKRAAGHKGGGRRG